MKQIPVTDRRFFVDVPLALVTTDGCAAEYFSKRFPPGHTLTPNWSGPFDGSGELESFQGCFLDRTLTSPVNPIIPAHKLQRNARGRARRSQRGATRRAIRFPSEARRILISAIRIRPRRHSMPLPCPHFDQGLINGLFHPGGPRMTATEAHAVTETLSVGRKDASRGDGNPVFI